MKSNFFEVMWVGRATVFLAGLVVIVTTVIGAASVASATVPPSGKGEKA